MHVIILGCGRVGSQLAAVLSNEGHNVVVIDRDSVSFGRLGKQFNGLTILGNGLDGRVLKEAGIEKADAFCSVTNGDNTNIIASQLAQKVFKVKKVIARVYDPHRAEIYRLLGLTVISGTVLFAAMIRDKLIEQRLSSYLLETGEMGMLEVQANEKISGKTIGELNVPSEFTIATLVKKNKRPIIPDSTMKIEKDDRFVGVVKMASIGKIKKMLGIED